MARKTGLAVPAIAADITVFIIHVCLIMYMAIDAGKGCPVRRIGMAVCTGIPLSLVSSRIHRKVRVMYRKTGRFPARVGGMAAGTGRGYIG